ncbi:hypothetical protein ASFV_Kyiv_2016_131_00095 [African swine fever virus]|uniref:Uncharacterized protein n=1 Tax=African swine fever virus TaxID=10497 RepID=A0A5B8XA50_ASF|nr:hypothetical protein ASFV_Kyiv_2016_131_00095 [African swine fever virus]
MDQEQLFDKLYSLNLQLTAKNDQKKENRFFIRSGKKIQRIQMMMFITVYDINQKQKKTLRSTWMQSEFESHRSSSA